MADLDETEQELSEQINDVAKSKEQQQFKTPAQQAREEERHKASVLISDTNAAAMRLEKANAEMQRLLVKQEKMKHENTIGGKASAGTVQKTQEQIEIEECKQMLAGTGFEEELFPSI